MAKKSYNVAERFQKVAENARKLGPIHTGPSGKTTVKVEGRSQPKPSMSEEDKENFRTRPGRNMVGPVLNPNGSITPGRKKDVHLSTGPKKK